MVIEDINLPNLKSIGAGAFNGTKVRKITSLGSEIVFPYASQNTGATFQSCLELTSISSSVFNNIVSISHDVFQGCTNLYIEELSMPKLKKIYPLGNGIHIRVIKDLGNITSLFSDNVLSFGIQSFGVPSYIEEYNIPSTVTAIGRYAFSDMKKLRYIICNPETPPTLSSASSIDSITCPIYVPDESVDAYRLASNWVNVASRIKPLSEYVES